MESGDSSATPEYYVTNMRGKSLSPKLIKGLWVSLKTQRMT